MKLLFYLLFDYYRQALEGVPGIEFMPEPAWSRSSRWLTVILITPGEFGASTASPALSDNKQKNILLKLFKAFF